MDAKLTDALTALCTELTNLLRSVAPSSESQRTPAPNAEPTASATLDDRPEWMKVDEFASATRVSRGMIYEMIRREELPVRRFGRLVRIHRDALRQSVPLPDARRRKR